MLERNKRFQVVKGPSLEELRGVFDIAKKGNSFKPLEKLRFGVAVNGRLREIDEMILDRAACSLDGDRGIFEGDIRFELEEGFSGLVKFVLEYNALERKGVICMDI